MKNIHKPNLPRSKRNPKGERNNPHINWPSYNKGRKSEGKYRIKWMSKIADMAHDIMDMPQAKHWRTSSILVTVVKSEEKLSYWGLIKHFGKYSGDLEKCELIRLYSKSQYQHVLSQIDIEASQQIYTWMAGAEAVNNAKIVDSGGYGIAGYEDLYNATYGKLSVKDFVKLHAMHLPQGKTCTTTVTPGEDNDSPYLIKDDAKWFR